MYNAKSGRKAQFPDHVICEIRVSQTWWKMLQDNLGKFVQFDRRLSFRLLRICEESLVKGSEGASSIQGGCSCHMVVPTPYLLVRRKLDWLQVSRCCKRRCKNLLLQHWKEKYKQCACRATGNWKEISARIRWQTWPRTHPDQVTQISFHTASVTWWNCWSQKRVVCPATPQTQAIKIIPPSTSLRVYTCVHTRIVISSDLANLVSVCLFATHLTWYLWTGFHV